MRCGQTAEDWGSARMLAAAEWLLSPREGERDQGPDQPWG